MDIPYEDFAGEDEAKERAFQEIDRRRRGEDSDYISALIEDVEDETTRIVLRKLLHRIEELG